ncbi:MAG: TlyA family rRNA (cytidine-2'-O)-methyltransferase [Rickettsiales bacterium]|nr:TlyA family rRNA (cytidine-2'-O)-methyltransferase [Rickettsiales bacterium]
MTKASKRERADKVLVTKDLAESRTRAQAMIMAGNVFIGEQRVDKPGDMIPTDAEVTVRGQEHPWVSRGGMKLDHGLEHFAIDPSNCTCIDVGASTGGFTDVLLRKGAAKVYAVDVGRGQLDWSLRQDDRVTVLEGTNARHLKSDQIPEALDLVVCDASFIGLEKVLPASLSLAKPGARLIALIKPQFQAGRKDVGKGGVVRDSTVHDRVCEEVRNWLTDLGWHVIGITKSPITGPKGNVEFLIAAQK